MATTALLSEETRDRLARTKDALHARSMDEAIRRLMALATPTAQQLFQAHQPTILAVCKRHGITRLVAFGSRVRDDRHPGSDLDLVASFPGGTTAFDLMDAQDELSEAFGCTVDLGSLPEPGTRLYNHITKEGVELVGPAS